MRVFVFDGDCAFCSSANRLLRTVTKDRIPTVPFQRADLDSLGLSLDQVETSVHYISERGRFSGARAIAECLVDSKTVWSWVGRIIKAPVIASISEIVYELVAKNRHRLPGGTPECQLPKQ